ncbi:hypothetical protein R1sor_004356 [Riccia sorocarpa]|uniref:Uncharacterized protein n=1 Tax=Riccia sorocarpa TaxID=122646 RepID=A0ABD3HGJ1_9MARC
MDKNKKKKARRKAKAAVAAANAGEHSEFDHSHGENHSGDQIPSLVAEESDFPHSSLLHSTSDMEPGKQENDPPALETPPLASEETQIFHRPLDDRLDGAADVDARDFGGGERLKLELYECRKKAEKMEMGFIIQMTRMQTLEQEKELAVRELQEALVIEKETADLLRDQLTYLQGHIAERDLLEVAELREKVHKLEQELVHAEEERRKLADENQRIISKEKEEGERVPELIKKIENLEQERGDLEEKQNRLKHEGKQMIVRMEQEGEKMEQLSRQMVLKMDTERQTLEQEIKQMSMKMEQEQQKLEKERLQMKAQLQQERLKLNEEHTQKTAHLTAEVEKLEKENRHIKQKLEQEREAFLHERNQLKAAGELERNTLEQEHLLMRERLNQEREQMEVEYKDKIEKLELDQENLEQNRRQITAKLTALDTQLEQLERESSVRERVFRDLATVTEVDASKNWESWRVYGKDPLAEAVAVAEEARIQRLAMAQTVDKLLAENVELMEKVNQQTVIISDLTKQMDADVKTSDVEGPLDDAHEVIWRPDMETQKKDSEIKDRIDGADSHFYQHSSGKPNGYSARGINGYIDGKSTHQSHFTSTGRYYEAAAAKPSKLKSVPEARTSIPDTSTSDAGRMSFESSESFTTLYEITEISDKDSSGTAELVKHPQESSVAPSKAPGRASSVIKAPVRFLSFVAGYISGADLVKD